MRPVVRFTGLDVVPLDLLDGRMVSGPIDPAWLRLRFAVEGDNIIGPINRWLAANINDRWAIYRMTTSDGGCAVVVAFETTVDAVLFRLKGGETAWRETISNET